MNIYIVMFMAVWVWVLISDIRTDKMMRECNSPFRVAIRGQRVVLNTRGKIIRDFVSIGFFIIIAYWLYMWFA